MCDLFEIRSVFNAVRQSLELCLGSLNRFQLLLRFGACVIRNFSMTEVILLFVPAPTVEEVCGIPIRSTHVLQSVKSRGLNPKMRSPVPSSKSLGEVVSFAAKRLQLDSNQMLMELVTADPKSSRMAFENTSKLLLRELHASLSSPANIMFRYSLKSDLSSLATNQSSLPIKSTAHQHSAPSTVAPRRQPTSNTTPAAPQTSPSSTIAPKALGQKSSIQTPQVRVVSPQQSVRTLPSPKFVPFASLDSDRPIKRRRTDDSDLQSPLIISAPTEPALTLITEDVLSISTVTVRQEEATQPELAALFTDEARLRAKKIERAEKRRVRPKRRIKPTSDRIDGSPFSGGVSPSPASASEDAVSSAGRCSLVDAPKCAENTSDITDELLRQYGF